MGNVIFFVLFCFLFFVFLFCFVFYFFFCFFLFVCLFFKHNFIWSTKKSLGDAFVMDLEKGRWVPVATNVPGLFAGSKFGMMVILPAYLYPFQVIQRSGMMLQVRLYCLAAAITTDLFRAPCTGSPPVQFFHNFDFSKVNLRLNDCFLVY